MVDNDYLLKTQTNNKKRQIIPSGRAKKGMITRSGSKK
jgi:hypothetical protein